MARRGNVNLIDFFVIVSLLTFSTFSVGRATHNHVTLVASILTKKSQMCCSYAGITLVEVNRREPSDFWKALLIAVVFFQMEGVT